MSLEQMISPNLDMGAKPVTSVVDNSIAYIVLNMPDTRNALSCAMMDKLSECLAEFTHNNKVRVIVISAIGPVFCAGHDLKEMDSHRQDGDKGRLFFETTMKQCSSLMLQIVHCPKPVIALIDGFATAAGCQLVASCDMALATTSSKFATPGVNIGLFCSTPMVALTRNIGRKQSMEMLMTGDPIEAEEAMRLGLINKAIQPDKIQAVLAELLEKLKDTSSLTLSRGKSTFYKQADISLEEAYDFTIQVMVENMLAADAKEGIDSFIEKRSPNWATINEENN